jgi:hypothetical protein
MTHPRAAFRQAIAEEINAISNKTTEAAMAITGGQPLASQTLLS